MKIVIVGAGGVGGYFGGLLAHSGQNVIFVARGEQLAAINRKGLRLNTVHGDYVIDPVHATDNMSDIGPAGLVIVCVKDYQLDGVLDGLETLMDDETTILPLLNGVQAAEKLTQVFGFKRVVSGLCKVVSFVVEPGLIKQASPFRSITFGEWGGQETERSKAIQKTLSDAGIDAELSKDIRKAMWTKFLFITSFSGVASVVRLPAGEIQICGETMAMLRSAMEEIEAVARAQRIELDRDIINKTMAFVEGLPAETTPSMQRDVMGGRLFELEAMTGSLIRQARNSGIETPVNVFLYAALKPQLIRAQKGMG
jgi:2-dehydropantoate 2-reductase